ncbi:TraB/GumN family protein [Erythrobacter rubeus]|uniref:TraB/GumN family protein n=1 Tax=Erythrobacter rubeus TaxID=2760803 RepID=A0ABR8KQA6_9SPHN|nr:TraB/GumN family protein [Erythrobacter rubeus]MBD2842948.1 TraB/GumN family protein [Erythrobacter rubeus]
MKTGIFTLAALAIWAVPATAQDTSAAPTTQNQIVVTAQRSGAPMWFIETETGTVILVGEIRAVPKSTPWQPDRLEEATAEADRAIIRARPKFSPGDVFRLIFRGGRFTRLPDKGVAADYLTIEQRARLAALEEEYDIDYDRRSFLMTSFDLLARRLDFDDDTTDDATDIVRKAADKADVPITRPERFRGEDLLDDLAEADPREHIPCLEAAMAATEAGQSIIEARGNDWRKFDVPAVMANPLEVALGRCWPWADAEVGEEIRAQWVGLIEEAAVEEGTSVAVVPLRVLAEEGGVLDELEGRGFAIGGPTWR